MIIPLLTLIKIIKNLKKSSNSKYIYYLKNKNIFAKIW